MFLSVATVEKRKVLVAIFQIKGAVFKHTNPIQQGFASRSVVRYQRNPIYKTLCSSIRSINEWRLLSPLATALVWFSYNATVAYILTGFQYRQTRAGRQFTVSLYV